MLNDVGLLVLRVLISLFMALGHGLPKLIGYSAMASQFPDPLGVGPTVSLILAIFGELVCPLLIAVGIFTRVAAVPALITMFVAAFGIHAVDPWAKKELALMYAVPFLSLLLMGPGTLSLDWLIRRSR